MRLDRYFRLINMVEKKGFSEKDSVNIIRVVLEVFSKENKKNLIKDR